MKKDTKLILIVLAGILAIVLLCVFAVQGTQNKAFTLEEQVNTAQSDIRVQEKRRVDLVYNLADCVMQYDKHEAETLTAIVEGRGSSGDIENVTTAITAVSEAYPELKANENYKELMNELYARKNHDYGDSFHTTFVEEGLAMARIRLGDKFSRFKTLSRLSCNDRDQQQVTDESIRDTLLDLANYAIMTVLEMDTPDESHATLYAYDKPIYTVGEDK